MAVDSASAARTMWFDLSGCITATDLEARPGLEGWKTIGGAARTMGGRDLAVGTRLFSSQVCWQRSSLPDEGSKDVFNWAASALGGMIRLILTTYINAMNSQETRET